MADLNRIQFKRTSTKGRRPDAGTMNPGELAINLADQYLLTKNDSGAIINLSCPPVYDRDVTMAGKVKGNNYILSKTANYLGDQTARDLNYFGAFRTNALDGLMDLTLNVPHSSGKAHGRGFTFCYGTGGSRVETYGFDVQGQKAFSYKMYHEGDKPTPGELNVYSKQEVDRMFVKNVKLATSPSDIVEGYFKLATAMIPQNGRSVFFRIHGGNGYNVTAYDQVDIVEIVIRSGNNRPKGVNVIAYRRNTNKAFDVLVVNTSGDNYDIYVKYQRYTDNVIVEFGKSVDVNLVVHDVPDFVAERPAGDNVIGGRAVTLFNTENKRGVLSFDDNTQNSYDIVHLSNDKGTGRKYIRKFRSNYNEMIWHETVQGNTYRLATGTTDASEVFRITSRTMFTGKGVFDAGQNVLRLERPSNQSNYIEWQDRRNGADARQGWIGFGSAETNNFMWYSDHGKNSFQLEANGQCSISTGANKLVYTNGEYCSGNSNAYRMAFGNYGAFWRNDGTKVYLLSTAENDKFGGWNTYRPFIYDLTSGNVQLGGDGNEDALTLERASRAARFSNDVYIKKGYLTFEAGRLYSRDYFRFNHWGDSNNARDNIIQLEDSQGAHFSTERQMSNGAIKTKFFGQVESNGQMKINALGDAIVLNAASNSSIHIRADVAGASNWYIGKGGNDNSISMYSYVTKGGIAISNNGEVALNPQGSGLMSVNRDRVHINGSGWIARHSGAWIDQWREEAPIFIDHGSVGQDSYYPLLKGRSRITEQGYVTAVDFGLRRVPGKWGQAIIRVASAEASPSSRHPQAVYEFHHDGTFYSPGNGNFNDVYIRSDSRLKINKEEYQANATDKVNTLKVYTYDKVKSLSDRSVIAREVGIIAQDLEKELPEAVKTSNVDGSDVLTISNSAVNALLIKAFQEMSEELKAVKAKLAALEKN